LGLDFWKKQRNLKIYDFKPFDPPFSSKRERFERFERFERKRENLFFLSRKQKLKKNQKQQDLSLESLSLKSLSFFHPLY
jgi:hypothetical protein